MPVSLLCEEKARIKGRIPKVMLEDTSGEFKIPHECNTPRRYWQHWGHSPRRNTLAPCCRWHSHPDPTTTAAPRLLPAPHAVRKPQELCWGRCCPAHSLSPRELAGALRRQRSPPALAVGTGQKGQTAQAPQRGRRARGLWCVSHEAQQV